jgi:hypothetical protein
MAADFGLEAGVPGAQVCDEEGVFIVLAGTAEIGLAEHGDTHGSFGHALLERM